MNDSWPTSKTRITKTKHKLTQAMQPLTADIAHVYTIHEYLHDYW